MQVTKKPRKLPSLKKHVPTSSSYFFLLKSFRTAIFSSIGDVSSIMITCLVFFDRRTISGLKVVGTTWTGNTSFFCSVSTHISQSFALYSKPSILFSAFFLVCFSFTKSINFTLFDAFSQVTFARLPAKICRRLNFWLWAHFDQ